MILTNLSYINGSFEKRNGELEIENAKIKFEGSLCPSNGERINMKGLTALPGFIDIHSHGGASADFCDGKKESYDILSKYYANRGVTKVCPTTMTLPFCELKRIFHAIEEYKGSEPGARFLNINMEGPFISKEKCGAQDPKYVLSPSSELFDELSKISKIALCDIAPESEGAVDFARKKKDEVVLSVAHTAATFEETKRAFEGGFSHMTHFLNAMTPFTSRAPGAVGACLESESVTAEIICDGYHLSPDTLRILFKILGKDRLVVISDSMSSAGCDDGEYYLGGQKVIVKDRKAHLENGTIAGSTTNMHLEFKNLLSFGISFEDSLRACTVNPARVLGIEKTAGSIEAGKDADIIFVDEKNDLKAVMIGGKFFPLEVEN